MWSPDRDVEMQFQGCSKKSCWVQERRGCQVTRTSFSTKRFNSIKNLFYTAAPTTTLGTGRDLGGFKLEHIDFFMTNIYQVWGISWMHVSKVSASLQSLNTVLNIATRKTRYILFLCDKQLCLWHQVLKLNNHSNNRIYCWFKSDNATFKLLFC